MTTVTRKGQVIEVRFKDENGTFFNYLAMNENDLMGTLIEVCGIPSDEVCYALDTMDDKGHDYCEFGMLGSFIFSKSKGYSH